MEDLFDIMRVSPSDIEIGPEERSPYLSFTDRAVSFRGQLIGTLRKDSMRPPRVIMSKPAGAATRKFPQLEALVMVCYWMKQMDKRGQKLEQETVLASDLMGKLLTKE